MSLLVCGHQSDLVESTAPDALLFCEECGAWRERDLSNGLMFEDLPDWDTEETR